MDAHLAVGRGDGLMLLGVLYLLVVAGQQALGFASAYGTAIAEPSCTIGPSRRHTLRRIST